MFCVDIKMHKIQRHKKAKNSNSRCSYSDMLLSHVKNNCMEQNKTKDVKKEPKLFFFASKTVRDSIAYVGLLILDRMPRFEPRELPWQPSAFPLSQPSLKQNYFPHFFVVLHSLAACCCNRSDPQGAWFFQS
jgi:hypothetical protein